jgi:hypothetical protein
LVLQFADERFPQAIRRDRCMLLGAFLVSIGLYEWVLKRVGLLRALFRMKAGPARTQAPAG